MCDRASCCADEDLRMLPNLAMRRRGHKARIWWAIALVAIGTGFAGWLHVRAGEAVASASQPSQSAAPVHVAVVERKDFPVLLNGLGTVQATNTVTVRSR